MNSVPPLVPRPFVDTNGRSSTQPGPGITVLMYHAIGTAGRMEAADSRYTVSTARFAQQLAMLSVSEQPPSSVQRLLERGCSGRGVAVTFDDGHESNARAAELLAELGGSADFFVNPSTVGTPHHLSWPELRAMAAMGMSIQSHGWSHRYLDELPHEEVREDLLRSRHEIEQNVGHAVTLFAPPGGRQPARFAELALECGYLRVCSSRVDIWHGEPQAAEVPRIAVIDNTSAEQFWRWIMRDEREFSRQRLRNQVLRMAKRVLGNGRYEAVRGRLLGQP